MQTIGSSAVSIGKSSRAKERPLDLQRVGCRSYLVNLGNALRPWSLADFIRVLLTPGMNVDGEGIGTGEASFLLVERAELPKISSRQPETVLWLHALDKLALYVLGFRLRIALCDPSDLLPVR